MFIGDDKDMSFYWLLLLSLLVNTSQPPLCIGMHHTTPPVSWSIQHALSVRDLVDFITPISVLSLLPAGTCVARKPVSQAMIQYPSIIHINVTH
jgi:hypothetical protein